MDSSEPFLTPLEDAAAWRDTLDAAGKRVVLTNGCFDLLHAGHVRYLNEARALGDALIVAINSDASTRELKGPGRPVHSAADRAEILRGLRSVDRVVVFDDKRATGVIAALRPHIYAKGGDYTADSLIPEERALLERIGTVIHLLSLVPGRSTSATLTRLQDSPEAGPRGPRLAVFGSGIGTNFAALLGAIDDGSLDAEIVAVFSDVADAGILNLARERGLPAFFIEPGTEKARLSAAAQKEILDRLKASRTDLVILAGFLRILTAPLLEVWHNKIVNLHPSLLPKYRGRNAWEQALAAGESEAGCTVHLVDAGIDTGRILAQATVPILPGDTGDGLYARIREQEHRLLPQAIRDYWTSLQTAETGD